MDYAILTYSGSQQAPFDRGSQHWKHDSLYCWKAPLPHLPAGPPTFVLTCINKQNDIISSCMYQTTIITETQTQEKSCAKQDRRYIPLLCFNVILTSIDAKLLPLHDHECSPSLPAPGGSQREAKAHDPTNALDFLAPLHDFSNGSRSTNTSSSHVYWKPQQ